MDPLCKVCDDLAAGFHFGVFTCEGCKSFFGRAFNKSQVIPDCRKKSKCVINKITRTACKACRLNKCIQVGMSKDGSRFGRRSNWFKMKFRLAEQPKDEQYMKAPSELMEASAPTTHRVESFQNSASSMDNSTTELQRAALPFLFDQTHALANPFYPPSVQYPLYPSLLHRAIEDFSNLYRHQQNLLQQHQHEQHQQHHSVNSSMDSQISEENDDVIEPPAKQPIGNTTSVKSPTPSPISSSTSSSISLNSRVTDDQVYPMDLSLKSRSPVDFSGVRAINRRYLEIDR